MGIPLWLMQKHMKECPLPCLTGFVRCSAHGHSFVRLQLWFTSDLKLCVLLLLWCVYVHVHLILDVGLRLVWKFVSKFNTYTSDVCISVSLKDAAVCQLNYL